MILTGSDLRTHLGDPSTKKFIYGQLHIWDVPSDIEIGFIPKKIYCHKYLPKYLERAFRSLIATGKVDELISWDGCWNLRPIRGKEKLYKERMAKGMNEQAWPLLSIHSWGLAIDVNAAQNGLGVKPKLTKEFVKCFTDAGFDWGGNFKRLDGMHFQLGKAALLEAKLTVVLGS